MSDDSDLGIVPLKAPPADDSDLGIKPLGKGKMPEMTSGDYLVKGLQGLGKGFDYQRGAVGAPILSKIASAISGKPTMSDQEYQNALNPMTTERAPSSDTILKRAGVPSGPQFSSIAPLAFQDPQYQKTLSSWNPVKYAPAKGGLLDSTPRGAAGAVLDMATDPLTYEMGGLNKAVEAGTASPALEKLASVVNAPSNAVEGVGKMLYNSGIAPMIAKGEKFKKSIGDSFYNNGIWGRSGTIASMGDAAAEQYGRKVADTMKAAAAAGASPSAQKAYAPLADEIIQMVADKRISSEKGDALLEQFAHKLEGENPNLNQMAQWKSDAYNSAGAGAYDITKNPTMAKRLSKIEGAGNKAEVERAASEVIPGAGEDIAKNNAEQGNFLTVQGVADKQAEREANRKMVSPQDVGHAVIAASASGKPEMGVLAGLGRLAAGLWNAPVARTSVGYGMRKAGTGTLSAPLIDAATAEILRNMIGKKQPVAGTGK